MNALEILLGRRWILKSRDRELYYRMKDEAPAIKKFLTEKLGYQMIVNPYLIKIEKMPAKPENWMGILEFNDKIEYVFFCMILMFLEEKEADGTVCIIRTDGIHTGTVSGKSRLTGRSTSTADT